MNKKIFFLFIASAILTILAIIYGIYNLTYSSLIQREEMKVKQAIAQISDYSAEIVDKESLAFLIDNLKPNISDDEIKKIESSPQFLFIVKQLKSICKNFRNNCTYLYIIYPFNDGVYFVVGADSLSESSVDDFSVAFDYSTFPYMQQALGERRKIVEPDLSFDPDYNIYSISSYSPIYDGNKFLGIVGNDLQQSDYDKIRYAYSFIAIFISVFGLLCIVITMLYISEKVDAHKHHSNI